jgi:hypothetical protein
MEHATQKCYFMEYVMLNMVKGFLLLSIVESIWF